MKEQTSMNDSNWRAVVLPAAASLLLCAITIASNGQTDAGTEDTDPQLDETRTIIEKWVETRRIISKEKKDWELGREILNDRIALMQRELEEFRSKISETEESITEVDERREELVTENEQLKQASAVLSDAVTTIEQRTTSLIARLPDPIRERIKPLSRNIPDDPDDTEASLSERFQNVIGILNEVTKFNGEITVTSEVHELEDGTSVEVTAVYIGIGQGYYVGSNETIAGVGTATADGWVWRSANDAAPQIAQAIAILENEQVASFVRLPIDVK